MGGDLVIESGRGEKVHERGKVAKKGEGLGVQVRWIKTTRQ